MSKKEKKKSLLKIIMPLAAVLIIIVLGCVAFFNMWAVKPSEDIYAITLDVLGDGGYSTVLITNDKKISEINESILKMLNGMDITSIKAIRAVEKYQKDPEFEMVLDYGSNSRWISVHKDTVTILNDNRTYFLQLENMDTEELRNKLNSYKR